MPPEFTDGALKPAEFILEHAEFVLEPVEFADNEASDETIESTEPAQRTDEWLLTGSKRLMDRAPGAEDGILLQRVHGVRGVLLLPASGHPSSAEARQVLRRFP